MVRPGRIGSPAPCNEGLRCGSGRPINCGAGRGVGLQLFGVSWFRTLGRIAGELLELEAGELVAAAGPRELVERIGVGELLAVDNLVERIGRRPGGAGSWSSGSPARPSSGRPVPVSSAAGSRRWRRGLSGPRNRA